MKRNGFTLVELLIVVVLGGLVLAAIFQILVSNQQIYTQQSQSVLAQQTVRGGIEYLSQEIRELSPAGGDLITIQEDRFEMRVMRKVGVSCGASDEGSFTQISASIMGPRFDEGDPVLIYYNAGTGDPADDGFAEGVVDNVRGPGSTVCGDGETRRLDIPSLNPPVTPAQVADGSLIRSFEIVTYTTMVDSDGETYLGRTRDGGTPEALIGPIAATDGLRFEYLDANGDPTSTPDAVRSIRLTIRTTSQARDAQGQPIEESLSVIVNPRN